MRIRWIALLAAAAILGSSCGNGTSTGPSASNLTGAWSGTSTYPNSPFQLSLTQTGTTLRGQYSDRLDRSLSVVGTLTSPTVAIVVDFGDAKLNLNGTVVDARTVEGTMQTSALGNTPYPFTMKR